MRLPSLILALVLALLALTGLSLVVPGFETAAPVTHPQHEAMFRSTFADADALGVLKWAWIAGLLLIALFACATLMGIRKEARRLRAWIVTGFVLHGLVYSAMIVAAGADGGGPASTYFGGLPLPTALLIYGVWLFPWVIVVGLIVHFETEFFTAEDEARFAELMRVRGKSEGSAG